MRITSRGQVTIPIAIRERLELLPGTEVELDIEGEAVRMTRAAHPSSRGRAIVERLRGCASTRLTTDEIMALTREPA